MKCSWCFFPDYLYLCQKKFPHQEIEKLSKSVKWAKVKAIALSLWILVNCIFLKTKCINSANCVNKVLCFLSIEVSSQILDKIRKNFMWSLKSLPRPPLRKCDLQKVTVRAGFSCRKEGMIQCEKLQICWGKELHESSQFLEFIWFILLGSVSIAWLHVFSNSLNVFPRLWCTALPSRPPEMLPSPTCLWLHQISPWNTMKWHSNPGLRSTATTQMLRCEPWTSHGWVCLFHCSMSAKNLCEVWLYFATKRGACGGNISFLCLLHPI